MMIQHAMTVAVGIAFSELSAGIAELPVPQLGNVTATAILGWYAWHTASKTIPALVTNFREEMANARAEFRSEREAFRQDMAVERQFRHEDNTAVVGAMNDLAVRLSVRSKDSGVANSRD